MNVLKSWKTKKVVSQSRRQANLFSGRSQTQNLHLFNEELAEVNARLTQYISQQKLQKVRHSLNVLTVELDKLPD